MRGSKKAYLSQTLVLQGSLQFPNNDVLCGDVKVAALLIVACPPVDAAWFIKWRNCPAIDIMASQLLMY